jgi:hypothetical protein
MEHIEDPSAGVSRTALRLLMCHAARLDAGELRAILDRTGDAPAGRHALRLFDVMPKWDAGAILLDATRAPRADVADMARKAVARWLSRYNRSFERPTEDELAAFARAVDAARLDESTRADLRHIVTSWVTRAR